MVYLVQKLSAALKDWEGYGSGIHESYHDEILWEIVEPDPEGFLAQHEV